MRGGGRFRLLQASIAVKEWAGLVQAEVIVLGKALSENLVRSPSISSGPVLSRFEGRTESGQGERTALVVPL